MFLISEAIEKFGLYNLADYLPKRPTEVELNIIKEMFEASVDGEPYDPDRWSSYYKPAGFQSGERANTASAAAPAPTSSVSDDTDDEPAEVAPVRSTPRVEEPAEASAPVTAKPSSQRAEDILAMIRSRSKS